MKKKFWVGLVISLSLILLCVVYFVVVRPTGKTLKLVATYEEITMLKNNNNSYNNTNTKYLIVKQNDKYGLIDFEGNIIEEIKYDTINYLADDYYYVEISNNKTLKRNGNVVEDITNYEKEKVYKDKNDENSLYIMLNEYIYEDETAVDESADIIILDDNFRAVYYKEKQNISGINVQSSSIIYNAETGKIVSKIPGMITKNNNNNNNNNYTVTYQLSTSMRTNTYYDKSFNNLINSDDFYFYSAQCDGNNYSPVVTNSLKENYGYYSINEKKLILPIEYENIYSVNTNETLFAVKKENKYALVDNKNKILLPYEYDYIVIDNNYIITIKNKKFNIYDSNLKIIDDYKFTIDDKKIANYGGMCDPEYKYINYQQILDENYNKLLSTLEVSTTDGLKTLLFMEGKIQLFDNNEYLNIIYSEKTNENYITISDIANYKLNNIAVYNLKMNKLFDVELANYNISLSDNELPENNVSSIYDISYDFDCHNFIISYTDNNDENNEIYFDIEQNKIVEETKYLYCRNINENYFYYPIYNEEKYREKYELYDNKQNKLLEYKDEIEILNDNYIIIDESKLYCIN